MKSKVVPSMPRICPVLTENICNVAQSCTEFFHVRDQA